MADLLRSGSVYRDLCPGYEAKEREPQFDWVQGIDDPGTDGTWLVQDGRCVCVRSVWEDRYVCNSHVLFREFEHDT